MKYFIIILLSGCALLSVESGNKDTPIDTVAVNSQVYITWVRFDNHDDAEKECTFLGLKAKPEHRIIACSSFNLKKRTCTIFATNPKTLNGEDMTVLGHEVKHCFDGAFHD